MKKVRRTSEAFCESIPPVTVTASAIDALKHATDDPISLMLILQIQKVPRYVPRCPKPTRAHHCVDPNHSVKKLPEIPNILYYVIINLFWAQFQALILSILSLI